MTTAYFRVIQVCEDGEIPLMPFQGFEQCGQGIVSTGLLGEKPTRVHPVIGRDAYESLGVRFGAGCRLKRFERREGEGNTHSAKEVTPIDRIHKIGEVIGF